MREEVIIKTVLKLMWMVNSELEEEVTECRRKGGVIESEAWDIPSFFEDQLKKLTPREEKITRLRFGFGLSQEDVPKGEVWTRRRVADHFEISVPRTHQIEKRALKKLERRILDLH